MRKMMAWLLAAMIPFFTVRCTDSEPQTQVRVLPESLAKASALTTEWIDRDPLMLWSWGEFVLLYGFWQLYEESNDPTILAYIQQFIQDNQQVYAPIASDWFSPATLDMLVCGETGVAENCDRIPEYDDYFNTVHREDGTLVHWTGQDSLMNQIWVDTLFMVGIYMIERPLQLEEAAANLWYDDVALQFEKFDQYLNDEATGLLNHGYDFANTEAPFTNGPEAFWGRGNSWYVASLGNLLKTMPDDHPSYPGLVELWRKRLDALLPLQDSQGFWHTLLLRTNDDYPEASATALITYGIASGLNAGLEYAGAREAVNAAIAGLDASIFIQDDETIFPQTSKGTDPGTIEDYLDIGVGDNITWGVGGYILAAIEAARLNGELE